MKKTNRIILFILFTAGLLAGCSGKYTGSPQPLACVEEELPGAYIIVEDISGERTNEGLISNSEAPEGTTEYIETTGRVTGWENRYMLVEPTSVLPGFILCEAVVFENKDGATQALHWDEGAGQTAVQTDRMVGDEMIVTYVEFTSPDNETWYDYRVEFTYQNLLGVVHTYAPGTIATADFALDLAEKMLSRFENPPALPTETAATTEDSSQPTSTP